MAAGVLLLPQIKRVCGEIMQMMYNTSLDYTINGQLFNFHYHLIRYTFFPL